MKAWIWIIAGLALGAAIGFVAYKIKEEMEKKATTTSVYAVEQNERIYDEEVISAIVG